MPENDWLRKLLRDLFLTNEIDLRGYTVPEWAQTILEEELSNARKTRFIHYRPTENRDLSA